MPDKETLYAFRYIDWTIEFGFGKLTNNAKKEIITILMEEMDTDRMLAFQACDADTTIDIVNCLLDEKWFNNGKTYKL